MERLRRMMNHRVSVEALLATAIYLALPYVVIGLVWTFLHATQMQQLQVRIEKVFPAGGDIAAFGIMTAFWPASLLIASSCPAN
jgi:hypothetical protein